MRARTAPHTCEPLRLGAVAYLNVRPLSTGLESLQGLEYCEAPPSRLAHWLELGRIDIGMVPVAAIINHPEWSVAPGTMIGTRGAVRSVIITGLGKPSEWRVLRPDAQSRTSNALSRILTERCMGLDLEPGRPVPFDEPEPSDLLRPGEAMVLIGSRALRSWARLRARGARIYDMGTLWTRWTGLPFVFAMWAIRPGAPIGGWLARLDEVKARNRDKAGRVASRWPGLAFDRLTPRQASYYLRRNVDFDFDAAARRGLERFYREGRELGLFADGWKLRIWQAGRVSDPTLVTTNHNH
ncbi:MAG: menaquinone biosynthesis protein [Candidatus Sumerlaeia bacterium]